MPFDSSTITDLEVYVLGPSEAQITWTSSSPSLPVQIYIDGVLSWNEYGTSAVLPLPSQSEGPLRLDVGNVQPNEINTNFSASLPVAPERRAELSWQGGLYLDSGLVSYRVYGSDAPGGAIDYSAPKATITAYPAGIVTDGFGLNGFGSGGFGLAAGNYTWTSDALASGVWSFAVAPVNSAGIEGTRDTVSITIQCPPREPGLFAGTNVRLEYHLVGYSGSGFGEGGFGMPTCVLNWNPPLYW